MKHWKWFLFIGILLAVLLVGVGWFTQDSHAASGSYKILAWNDLGMHCYNRDFADMAVLPPYNTLWVQVVKVGDPPELVTSGITVEYSYADNTYSVGKTNFWDYEQALFGQDLPPNVGLKGKGLSGTMDLSGDHFIAEGIPITEYSDSAPTVRQPYQLATVVVKESATGTVLTSTQVVTPTSSEMRCDNCHSDTGIARPETPTGKVETNILRLHDEETGTQLMSSRPVLCASCHGSNALGAPGKPGIKNLSNAMHVQHAEVIPNTLDGCYNCHPGPQTRCLRDVMATKKGMTCINCHGGMANVSTNPNPWLNEPRCDTCHNSGHFNQDQALYRFSKGHGGLYCESCHDSTHAIAPSREANDAIKFNQLQGQNGPLQVCSVCHSQVPASGGPHNVMPVEVMTGGNHTGTYYLNSAQSKRDSYTGLDNGPVKVFSQNAITPILASERFIYSYQNSKAYAEMIGYPDSQLATEYWFPWYNNKTYSTQLRVSNMGTGSAQVKVYAGTSTTPIDTFTLGGGEAKRISYNIDNGPLHVVSTDGVTKILASERFIQTFQASASYSEMMGYPGNQLATEYWFPWYNNKTYSTQLRVSNMGAGSAEVKVYAGSSTTPIDTFTLSAGEAKRISYNIDNGPLHVVSTDGITKILVSERFIYTYGASASYAEMMGYPGNQLTTEYCFPWYNNTSDGTIVLSSQLRVSNMGASTAQIKVYLAGTQLDSFSVTSGQGARKIYASSNNGPLCVVSTDGVTPILASERFISTYLSSASYSEMMGYPRNRLDDTYWFPWYNNVNYQTELRMAKP